MNRFRTLGFIDYNGRIKVHKSLLNVILHDQGWQNATSAPLLGPSGHQRKKAVRVRKSGETS
jgi:hypothetical protein